MVSTIFEDLLSLNTNETPSKTPSENSILEKNHYTSSLCIMKLFNALYIQLPFSYLPSSISFYPLSSLAHPYKKTLPLLILISATFSIFHLPSPHPFLINYHYLFNIQPNPCQHP